MHLAALQNATENVIVIYPLRSSWRTDYCLPDVVYEPVCDWPLYCLYHWVSVTLWLATIVSIPLGLSHSVTCHYTVYTSTTGSQSHSLHCSFNLCLTLAQRSLYHRQTLHNDIHTQCSQLKRNRPSDIRTMSQKIITTFIYDNQKRCCRWTHELWTEARKDKSEKWRMVASDKWRNTTIMINN